MQRCTAMIITNQVSAGGKLTEEIYLYMYILCICAMLLRVSCIAMKLQINEKILIIRFTSYKLCAVNFYIGQYSSFVVCLTLTIFPSFVLREREKERGKRFQTLHAGIYFKKTKAHSCFKKSFKKESNIYKRSLVFLNILIS